MAEKKYSIVDIAEMSGVSIATVSRILNKSGRYSAETEKKVMAAVKKCNYKINLNAKALRTNKTQSIGVIVPDITNEFFAKIAVSIEMSALENGYTVLICNTNEDEKTEDLQIGNLNANNVDGIIFISGRSNLNRMENSLQLPTIFIDRAPTNAKVLIQSDNEYGGYLAGKELINCGCKNPIMLCDYRMLSPTRQRLSGFKKALAENNVVVPEKNFINVKVDYEYTRNTIEDLIKSSFKFDGIFAINDLLALSAIHALDANDIKVPDDVKVIGFDDVSIANISNPSITTIKQDTLKMGTVAFDTLLKLLNKEKIKQKNIVIPVQMVKRMTT